MSGLMQEVEEHLKGINGAFKGAIVGYRRDRSAVVCNYMRWRHHSVHSNVSCHRTKRVDVLQSNAASRDVLFFRVHSERVETDALPYFDFCTS